MKKRLREERDTRNEEMEPHTAEIQREGGQEGSGGETREGGQRPRERRGQRLREGERPREKRQETGVADRERDREEGRLKKRGGQGRKERDGDRDPGRDRHTEGGWKFRQR